MSRTAGLFSVLVFGSQGSGALGRARTKYLSSEVAGGFTGVAMGLYAVDGSGRWARFEKLDWKQGE